MEVTKALLEALPQVLIAIHPGYGGVLAVVLMVMSIARWAWRTQLEKLYRAMIVCLVILIAILVAQGVQQGGNPSRPPTTQVAEVTVRTASVPA
jgi:hypothetical protein